MAPSTSPARSSNPLSAPNSKSRIPIHSSPTTMRESDHGTSSRLRINGRPGNRSLRTRAMPSSAGPTNSQATALSDRFTRRLRQRLLQGRQLFEALRHRRGAADDVVHDGDRLAVVLAEPRLLERVDRPALLVLLAQELE